jgi:hypothetical protein
MYAVLCNPIFWNEINQAVFSKGEEILIKDIDTDIDVISAFEKIGRISIKHLIIDLSAIKDTKKLLLCIKRYRIKNDKTQIIIIAPNISPPNQVMDALVTMGIYDIIAPKVDKLEDIILLPSLVELFENPSPFKKAVRWFLDGDLQDEKKDNPSQNIINGKSERDIIERTLTITKEKIIGTVVIGVAGTMNRIGTTQTSLLIAEFLKNNNFSVAILELHDSDNFQAIVNSYEDVKDDGDYFEFDGLDFYPYNESLNVLDILQNNYNYLVLDMGVYQNCDLTEFKRANVRVLVSGVKDWELKNLDLILRAGDTIYKNLYYFNFADKSAFDTVQANMNQCKCFQAPYNPNPFSITKDCTNMFKKLLKDVIPEVKQANTNKNSGFLKGLFNKQIIGS